MWGEVEAGAEPHTHTHTGVSVKVTREPVGLKLASDAAKRACGGRLGGLPVALR